MPKNSLRALLEHAIDYAGLFPPANLALVPALKNQADYVRSPERWMLGTFILPVAEFDVASAHLALFDREHPLAISALGPKIGDAGAFPAAIKAAGEAIAKFSAVHGELVSVRQLEMPLPPNFDLDSLGKVPATLGDLKLTFFWEAPADRADAVIAALAAQRAGFKLRTGGVTADAFPTTAQVACALVAAAKHRVPIKFTAGLHHPLRKFDESVGTKMHGFLNVLGAGVLAAEHEWNAEQTNEMLVDENAGSLSFDDDVFAWREWKISTVRIAERRRLVKSLGSCSFDEPRDDLRALHLF